jgi:hypothetical protein
MKGIAENPRLGTTNTEALDLEEGRTHKGTHNAGHDPQPEAMRGTEAGDRGALSRRTGTGSRPFRAGGPARGRLGEAARGAARLGGTSSNAGARGSIRGRARRSGGRRRAPTDRRSRLAVDLRLHCGIEGSCHSTQSEGVGEREEGKQAGGVVGVFVVERLEANEVLTAVGPNCRIDCKGEAVGSVGIEARVDCLEISLLLSVSGVNGQDAWAISREKRRLAIFYPLNGGALTTVEANGRGRRREGDGSERGLGKSDSDNNGGQGEHGVILVENVGLESVGGAKLLLLTAG